MEVAVEVEALDAAALKAPVIAATRACRVAWSSSKFGLLLLEVVDSLSEVSAMIYLLLWDMLTAIFGEVKR